MPLKVMAIRMPVLPALLTGDQEQYFWSTVGNPWMPRAEGMHVLHLTWGLEHLQILVSSGFLKPILPGYQEMVNLGGVHGCTPIFLPNGDGHPKAPFVQGSTLYDLCVNALHFRQPALMGGFWVIPDSPEWTVMSL